jgi:hypothetical protein
LGFLEHAVVEGQPAQIAFEVPVFRHRQMLIAKGSGS